MNKEVRAWLLLLAWVLIGTSPVIYAATTQQPAEEVLSEPTEDIIRWKEDCEEDLEVTVKPLEQYEPKFYKVPLPEELQLHVFKECEKHNIAPSIILAMIERESGFKPDEIGDDGESFGLMQIQPRWWQELMDELGCNDLLDPYQNITVGVAIVDYFRDKNPDIYWVLMNYNMRPQKAQELWDKGEYTEYATEIVERAAELDAEYEEVFKWQ